MSEFDPSDRNISDSALLSWIAIGTHEAVEPLIRRHERSLMAFLTRATRDHHAAEDLFQEIWIRVVRSAARFDPSLPFTPWLFRIAWNVVLTQRQRQARRPEESLEAAGEVASRDETAHALERREDEARTRELIDALPPKLAATVLLKYYQELTEGEVAERLGVPVGTVKSRLHTALRRLGDALRRAR